MWIALQYFLDLQRQAVHPTPHVGVADGQSNPNSRRDRDHRSDNALTTAAANPAGIEAGMHMRAFPGKLDFDRWCRSALGVMPDRRDNNLGESFAGPERPAPAINLARTNIGAASDFRSCPRWWCKSAVISRFPAGLAGEVRQPQRTA
jgi:hypothetical protein